MLNLTKLRKLKGLSKARLARRADLDQGLVGKIESGRTRPYKSQLGRLALVLGIAEELSETLLDEASTGGIDA